MKLHLIEAGRLWALIMAVNALIASAEHGQATVIANGTIQLGVGPEGQLRADGTISNPPPISVRMRFLPTGAEAMSFSSDGWGVAALDPANTAITLAVGSARESASGMIVQSFVTTPTMATSTVNVGNVLRVRHIFFPSAATPNLYQVSIDIENISAVPARVLYRRVMSWSCEPTPFNNFVTLYAGTVVELAFSSNDGFASANPLAAFSDRGAIGSFVDFGPAAQGALFDLDFGTLAPGATKSFTAYYGATADESDADAAMTAVGAQVYSYGQANISDGGDVDAQPDGPQYGIPNTFIFGLSGLVGTAALPPLLFGMTPNYGGNCGEVTLSLNGRGIKPGATVKLTSVGPDIVGTAITVSPSGSLMTATFDLNTAPVGVRDVTVTNPDGTTVTMAASFTVQPCLPAPLSVQISGSSLIGVGRQSWFTLTYANAGNINMQNVPLCIGNIPPTFTVQVITTSPAATITSSATEQTVCFIDPIVPPGQTHYFIIALKPPVQGPFSLIGEAKPPFSGSSTLGVNVVASFDPNDKVGPPGVGPAHYITGSGTLAYQISFENKPDATAPAQEVFITDRIDPSRFDIASFTLGPISFGGQSLVPPPGLQNFSADLYLPLEVDHNAATIDDIIIRIEVTLVSDPMSSDYGQALWAFRSIDPLTGRLPANPFRGFLPPNVIPPEGQGSVLFSINARLPLVTGDFLGNSADIVFDVNAPIVTPVWGNRIDLTAPSSAVVPLAATQGDSTFNVSWVGTDPDAGIQSYTIFVSQDGAPYAIFLSGTTATTAPFIGQNGSTYRFYSVATDQLGHVEDAPALADASTTVIVTTTPSEKIANLIALVKSMILHPGTENALVVKLQAALNGLNANKPSVACARMQDFVHLINSEKAKKDKEKRFLTPAQANQLLEAAAQIMTQLGC